MFNQPTRHFLAGLNKEELRRQRQSDSLSLRRKDREAKLENKRKKILKSSQSQTTTTRTARRTRYDSPNELIKLLPRLVQGLYQNNNNKAVIFECIHNIRKLVSMRYNPPIKDIIDSGIIPRIIQFLRWKESPEIQFEAMWILTNIAASDKAEYTAKIIRDGSITVFIDLLDSASYPLKDQAIWCLGNIAGECLEIRDMILTFNILPNVLKICQSGYNHKYNANYDESVDDINKPKQYQFISLLNNTSWTISNLCRYKIYNKKYIYLILQCLWYLIKHYKQYTEYQLIENIGWSFFYLTKDREFEEKEMDFMNIINKSNILKELIIILQETNGTKYINKAILMGIGNILVGNDMYTQNCIDNGLLKCLYKLLIQYYTFPKSSILKEICWCLSNITAGNKQQIISVYKANIFPVLIKILIHSKILTAKEAMWTIANATKCEGLEIVQYLVNNGIIKEICIFAKRLYGNYDDKVLMVLLQLIENILIKDVNDKQYATEFEVNGGFDFLEYLQSDNNVSDDIYNKSAAIVHKYFDRENENDFDLNNDDDNNNDITSQSDNRYRNQFEFGLKQNVQQNTFQF